MLYYSLALLSEMVRGFFIVKIKLVQKRMIYFFNADKLRVINRKNQNYYSYFYE